LWVSAGGRWQNLGAFRSSDLDSIYRLGGEPEIVRVTTERTGVDRTTPGPEALTASFS
jgi:hypothetical protein